MTVCKLMVAVVGDIAKRFTVFTCTAMLCLFWSCCIQNIQLIWLHYMTKCIQLIDCWIWTLLWIWAEILSSSDLQSYILDNVVLQPLWQHFGEGSFRHDCDPVHKAGAKTIEMWFDDFGMKELVWFIKPIWDELEWKLWVTCSCPTSVPDLLNAPHNEYAQFPTKTL